MSLALADQRLEADQRAEDPRDQTRPPAYVYRGRGDRAHHRAWHCAMSDRKRVVRDDDAFFKRNPQRRYRIRRVSPVEVRQKRLNGGLPTLPQGLCWFLVIRHRKCEPGSPAPGRRIALFAPHLDDAETDVDEDTAHAVFDHVAAAVGGANATRH